MAITAGLDVGGAHLKVALVEDGRPIAAEQIVCPLWLGLDRLDAALEAAKPLTRLASRIAVTMTGELSDLFPDRRTGVETLVERLTAALGPATLFWMGRDAFGSDSVARANAASVGSTNFLATAEAVAHLIPDALVIDMGSTTTDIVPIKGGRPVPAGLTDGERLASGELVYTGLSRTPVMGVAMRAPFKGREQRLAREQFATMADVRRILSQLPEEVDQYGPPDGRGKTLVESMARLARMFGRDAIEGTPDDWQRSARAIAEAQLASIEEGARQVLARSDLPATAPLIAAGIGHRVIGELADGIGRNFQTFGQLTGVLGAVKHAVTHCAPAVAVALLAEDKD